MQGHRAQNHLRSETHSQTSAHLVVLLRQIFLGPSLDWIFKPLLSNPLRPVKAIVARLATAVEVVNLRCHPISVAPVLTRSPSERTTLELPKLPNKIFKQLLLESTLLR